MLLEWGQRKDGGWDSTVAGPDGISPLHLAALLRDGGATAHLLVRHTRPGPTAWFGLETVDRQKPAHFAARAMPESGRPLHASMMRALAAAASSTQEPPKPLFTGMFNEDGSPAVLPTNSGTSSEAYRLLGGSEACTTLVCGRAPADAPAQPVTEAADNPPPAPSVAGGASNITTHTTLDRFGGFFAPGVLSNPAWGGHAQQDPLRQLQPHHTTGSKPCRSEEAPHIGATEESSDDAAARLSLARTSLAGLASLNAAARPPAHEEEGFRKLEHQHSRESLVSTRSDSASSMFDPGRPLTGPPTESKTPRYTLQVSSLPSLSRQQLRHSC